MACDQAMYDKTLSNTFIILLALTCYTSVLVVLALVYPTTQIINIQLKGFEYQNHQRRDVEDFEKEIQSIFSPEKCKEDEKMRLITSGYDKRTEEITSYIDCHCSKRNKCVPNTRRISVNMNVTTMDEVFKESFTKILNPGGWYVPKQCKTSSVAIVIPYRNRESQLSIFLRHYHPIFIRQKLHYRIFVIDQVDKDPFNRGKLMNVGYNEAKKYFPYDCVVFHDVDLLLEDDRLMYSCQSSPQHLSVSLDKYNYRLLYQELFGGIEMFTRDHFELINGFSNSFWGWGAEDDNLYRRLAWKGLTLWRPSVHRARYKMIKHDNAEVDAKSDRFDIRKESYKHFATDGLSSLKYEVKETILHPTHTHVKVDLHMAKDDLFGIVNYEKPK
ncbi:beta-1,4-N-acetylgalactosaminyltransferase bre-4-like isoform X2 [Clytia hemisphaerica]|uniref:beta-1,4-N-acetylgalactosaminyltransferase bre-4-like isoform X2 n=1 Tax=Clytia hemisphaerica TaxID=252671 RepID=UPI0034D47CAF